jgi:type I restriction enzyme S subunit
LRKGDIVFGRKGAVERHALIDESVDGWIQGSDCLRLRIKSQAVCERYLSHYLKTQAHQDWMQALCSFGATMTSLNQDIVRRISFPAPPIEVQKRIAATLTAYGELIENNQRRIALLEKMAEEIYREWFVRLRFPGHGVMKVSKGVPSGWEQKYLPEIADITYGFAFDASRFNTDGKGKPIVRIRNISESLTTDYTEQVANDKYIVRNGDLVVGMDGEFHINHWRGDEAYLVQRVCKIEAKNPLLKGYLALAIRAPIKHYESILMGATVGHLGAMHLKNISLLVPPEQLHKRLQVLNDMHCQILRLSKVARSLSVARDGLLPRLISGKLAVNNLDIHFPSCMAEEI